MIATGWPTLIRAPVAVDGDGVVAAESVDHQHVGGSLPMPVLVLIR
jgi:hypothetical protein